VSFLDVRWCRGGTAADGDKQAGAGEHRPARGYAGIEVLGGARSGAGAIPLGARSAGPSAARRAADAISVTAGVPVRLSVDMK